MLKKKLNKMMAIILIFMLTFTNFAFVTESYAASFFDVLLGNNPNDEEGSVEFNAFLETESAELKEVISDINNQELAIKMNLMVENAGYLKDGKIEIKGITEDSGINFAIKEIDELPELVQNFEDGIITLKQIATSDNVQITIPIEYKNEKYFDSNDLSKYFVVVFSGIYVDNNGDETETSKEEELLLTWTDSREATVTTSLEKFIDFGRGVIIQTKLTVDSTVENKNTLPIQKTQLNVEVPKYMDMEPSKIVVVANSTKGTNGEDYGETTPEGSNWSYNKEEGKITITAYNTEKTVEINKYEDEFIQNTEEYIEVINGYYNEPGVDEFLITYTYEDAQIQEEPITLSSEVELDLSILSGVEQADFNKVENFEYQLSEATGNIISLSEESVTQEISKSYFYINMYKDEYELNIDSKSIINISYKDIVENIQVEDIDYSYINKQNEVINNDDIYYKQIIINKENFKEILGEDGVIGIYSLSGEQIGAITFPEESEGQEEQETEIVVDLNEQYTKLRIETSAPISEGNLSIRTVKAIKRINLGKAEIANLDHIESNSVIRAKYNYVDNYVDIDTANFEVKLLDTETKANIELDRETLKTLELNEDVLVKIKLNNERVESDIYGYSEFIVEFPEYVENIEIKEAVMINAEGLEIKSYEASGRQMKIIIDGTQESINTGKISGGANIQITANIKVNEFTPLVSREIKLQTSNAESTNYYNEGNDETLISFSAPTGVISATNYYNYNSSNEMITSLSSNGVDGVKGVLDIYSEARTVKNEIVVMNNTSNVVSNVKILGRFPSSEDKLGTTADVSIISPIVVESGTDGAFRVLYSENAEATNELENIDNGWFELPEAIEQQSLDNIKSFLIIPIAQDGEDYLMNSAQILRFSYQFLVPASLPHNEYIYSIFTTYYRDLSEIATVNKTSVPDEICLTTGVGPEFDVDVSSSKQTVREYEEFEVDVSITNIGEYTTNNINLQFPIPNGTKYERIIIEEEGVTYNFDESNQVINLHKEVLGVDEEIDFTVVLIAQEKELVNDDEVEKTVPEILISADGLDSTLEAKGQEIIVIGSELKIELLKARTYEKEGNKKIGDELTYYIIVSNLKDTSIDNLVLKTVLDNELKAIDYKAILTDRFSEFIQDIEVEKYNENTGEIVLKGISLAPENRIRFEITTKIENMQEGASTAEIYVNANVTGNNVEEYNSNTLLAIAGRSDVQIIAESTNITNTYVTEGEEIEYIYTVKNKGVADARNVEFKDIIPDGITIKRLSYTLNGSSFEKRINSNDEAVVTATLSPGEELQVNLYAVAGSLNGKESKKTLNQGAVSSDETAEKKSEGIELIIEPSEESTDTNEESSSSSPTRLSNGNSETSNNSSRVNTYRITGVAWLDENRDGTRNSSEKLLPGISVTLINNENGALIQTATTNSTGAYTFTGIANGNYLAIFDFDTEKYTVTAFKKEGILDNMNSDAFIKEIIQQGKSRIGAVTETINISGGSISGIDLGLVLAKTFDLKLDKSITKVTVQTINGTDTVNYKNAKIAKTEIGAKYLSGSTVYVEYEFTVTNIGDIPGYATKIVDYMPEGMVFNSTLGTNSDWYTGSDGNLYTEQIAKKQLAKGQSTTFKLVLTRQMTEENTDIVSNIAEIFEDYNTQGYTDLNSKAGNKAQGENDMSSADLAIMVKTGAVFINVSIISTTLLLMVIVVFMVYAQISKYRKIKGGV